MKEAQGIPDISDTSIALLSAIGKDYSDRYESNSTTRNVYRALSFYKAGS